MTAATENRLWDFLAALALEAGGELRVTAEAIQRRGVYTYQAQIDSVDGDIVLTVLPFDGQIGMTAKEAEA